MPLVVRTKPRSALILAALLLLPTACSDGDATPSRTDGEGSSSAPAPTESETASETESETPPAPTTSAPETTLAFPDAGTAAGVTLREQSVAARAPEGWQRSPSMLGSESTATSGNSDLVKLSDLPVLGGTALPELSHDQLAELTIKSRRSMNGGEGRFRRQPDVVVDGVAFVRVVGTDAAGYYTDEIVVEHEGRTVSLLVRLSPQARRADPTLPQAVINSLTWR